MEDFYDVLLNKIKEDDFYALLGCDELATTEQINAEFRQKAKLHHPDKNPGDKTAEKLFERLVHVVRFWFCTAQKEELFLFLSILFQIL